MFAKAIAFLDNATEITYLGVVVAVASAVASEHAHKHLAPAAAVFAAEQKNSHNLLSVQAPCQWPENKSKKYKYCNVHYKRFLISRVLIKFYS